MSTLYIPVQLGWIHYGQVQQFGTQYMIVNKSKIEITVQYATEQNSALKQSLFPLFFV